MITDCHIHIEPIELYKPRALELMKHERANFDKIAHKTLFGTDWPGPGVPDLKRNLEEFKALPMSAETREQILGKTAASVWPE
jgi:predicted TIM-barrel fold metal-dependent hydrolase